MTHGRKTLGVRQITLVHTSANEQRTRAYVYLYSQFYLYIYIIFFLADLTLAVLWCS